MAKWFVMSERYKESLREWIAAQPRKVRKLTERYGLEPDVLYHLKDSDGLYCVVAGLSPCGHVNIYPVDYTQMVADKYVKPDFGTVLAGFNPEDLEEADLPPTVKIFEPAKHYH